MRGEVVGIRSSLWEVVVESTGDMLLRSDAYVRPAKQTQVVVQQIITPASAEDTIRRISNSEIIGPSKQAAAAPPAAEKQTRRGSMSSQQQQQHQYVQPPMLSHAATLSAVTRRTSASDINPNVRRVSSGSHETAASVASWSAANQPRPAGQKKVSLTGAVVVEEEAYVPRVVSDTPCAIYTLDGNKRTLILTQTMTAREVCLEILSRWKFEAHVDDVVLVSIVKDEMTVVRNTPPLNVKNKWPLIVSSNKNEIPKCRFVVRCVGSPSAKMREILGEPIQLVNYKVV